MTRLTVVIIMSSTGSSTNSSFPRPSSPPPAIDVGDMQTKTIIGIVLGIICFAGIIVAIWTIPRCFRKSVPPLDAVRRVPNAQSFPHVEPTIARGQFHGGFPLCNISTHPPAVPQSPDRTLKDVSMLSRSQDAKVMLAPLNLNIKQESLSERNNPQHTSLEFPPVSLFTH
ncbi:hypothetical protein V8B97DRAFT_1019347 [Scleroderma yunnanense]